MHIDTKCVQEGYKPKNSEPRVLPIYQSTTYKYDSSDVLGDLFDLKVDGHMYTRISNPTTDAVEKKIAALEGGVGALCTSSGQAASLIAVTNIAESGDNIICNSAIYGGSLNLFAVTLKKWGIETRFITDNNTPEEIEALIDDRTKLIFGETESNPALEVLDFDKLSSVAHKNGIPLIVDNTFATPIFCHPFELGADIVTHSTSKYMDGHACVLGGVVVDGGRFDWKASGKFPMLTEPDESFHGVVYTERFGNAAYINKARNQLLRDLGCTPTPYSMFILNMNLETLHLRMPRHYSNALAIAKYLEADERVAWVNFPKLPSSPQYAKAEKYLPDGCSGVISFGVKGGREAAVKFMDSLKLINIVVHVADARSSVIHPASTTHRQLTDEQLVAAGVGADLIRMSIGIEDANDLINDIDQALDIACK